MIAHDVRDIAFKMLRRAQYEDGNRLHDLAHEIELMEIDHRDLAQRARRPAAPPAAEPIDLTGMLSPMPVAIEMDLDLLARCMPDERVIPDEMDARSAA